MAYKLDLGLGVKVLPSDLKKAESQLNNLYKKYEGKSISPVSDSKTNKPLKTYNTEIEKASKNTKGFASNMQTAIERTIQWTIAVGGLYSAIHKVRDSIDFTTQFDTSLTEIAMVTGVTREETALLKDEYLVLADAINVSSLELANSAVALYRQGLSADEVNSRLSEISKTAKVAGLSVEQVTQAVTSGVNAMKVSAVEFNDVLLKTASVAATDYEKLAQALQKSATGFTSAGFSLQEASGIIATIQEVTQESASSIGTSMKTILARFNKLTEEGKDNTDTLNQIDTALQSIGLTLQDANGQFRDTNIVIEELGSIWNTLDRNTQNYLGTTIAGARQIERFRVLMSNYSRTVEITEQAYDAAGTTQEQYLKFQESIQGKLNELQVAWEKFYDSLVNEGAVSDFIDFATGAVNLLTELNETVGVANVAVAGLATKLILLIVQLKATEAGLWTTLAASEALKASLTFGVTLIGTALVGAWIRNKRAVDDAKESYENLNKVLAGEEMSTSRRIEVLEQQLENLNTIYSDQAKAIEAYSAQLEYLEDLRKRLEADEPIAEEGVTLETIQEQRQKLIKLIEEQRFQMGDLVEVEKALASANRELANESYAEYMDNYVRNLGKVVPKIIAYATATEKLTDKADENLKSMSSLASTYKSINDGEKLSIENIFELARLYPDYSSQILGINDSKEKGKKLTEILFEAEKQRAINALIQSREELKSKNDLLAVEKELLRVKAIYGEVPWTSYYSFDTFDDEILDINRSILLLQKSTIKTFNGIEKASKSQEDANADLSKSYEDMAKLVIEAIKDQEKATLEMHKAEKDLIEESIKRVEEAEREKLKIKYDMAKQGYEAQKDALQKEFDDAKYVADKEERLEEIRALESKLLLSLTEKERYEIQEQVTDLRKQLSDEELEHNLENELDKIDAQLTLAEVEKDAKLDAIDEKTNAVVESAKVQIYWEGELTEVTVAEARKRLETVTSNIEDMESAQTEYAKIAESIMTQSADNVYSYLEDNLAKFKEYTEEMRKQLQETLALTTSGQVSSGTSDVSKYAIPDATTVSSAANTAHQKAQSARSELISMGYADEVDFMSKFGAVSADEWLSAYKGNNPNTPSEVISLFKKIVDSKYEWNRAEPELATYHNGGVVGNGLAIDPQKEEFAKLLKGEMVLTEQMQSNLMSMMSPNMPNVQNNNSSFGDVNVKVEMSGVTISSEMDIERTAQSLGDKIGKLTEVLGIQTQRVRNSRR